MSQSDYVFSWIVQDACDLTDEQRIKLLRWLDGISGAIQECPAWSPEGRIPSANDSLRSSSSIFSRGGALLEDLLKLETPDIASCFDEEGHIVKVHPRLLLKNVIRLTYEGRKPEKEKIPDILPKKPISPGMKRAAFLKKHLWPLYLDSLQLKKTEVYKFCWMNDIEQIRKVPGFILLERPQEKQIVVPRELWAERTPSKVRDSLRKGKKRFALPIVAYVLLNWCKLKNKTEIGRLLHHKKGLVDSSYWDYADKLLKEADALKIVTD